MDKSMICPRCLKNLRHGVHTCTPTKLVGELELKIDALSLALETENEAATRYAQQVAHWIEKHDAVKQQRDELLTICRNVVDRGIGASDVKAMREMIEKVGADKTAEAA